MEILLPGEKVSAERLQEGIMILVDKPLDWTSFDVVNKIKVRLKYALSIPKIKCGHAGTLDPKATGLLVICTGKYTKLLDSIQDQRKTYTGTIFVGATRPSHDLETEIDQYFDTQHIDEQLLEKTKNEFLGEQSQLPPMFSAIKVDGQPIYKKARKGKTIELQPRTIHIYSLDIDATTFPEVYFKVQCSKGTYIRSLAYDFGKALGSGAYLSSLRRTDNGDWSVEKAWQVEALIQVINEAGTALSDSHPN